MKRRAATVPKKIRLTEDGITAIQSWADQHGMSFSAAVETLCQLGLGTAPDEALAPAVISVIRREISGHYDRLIRLVLYGVVEAGTASRMSSAVLRYLYTKAKDDMERFERTKKATRTDARRSLGRAKIKDVIDELLKEGKDGDH